MTTKTNGYKIILNDQENKLIQIKSNPTLSVMIKEIENIKSVAEMAEVTDESSAKLVDNYTINAKSMLKNIEAARIEIVKPHNDYVTKVNSVFKKLTTPLKEAYNHTGMLYATWAQGEARKLREAQEKAAKIEAENLARQEAQRLEREKKAKENNIPEIIEEEPEPITVDPVVFKAPPRGLREVWTYEVIDINKVPREFLCLDEKAVKAHMKGDSIADVSGLKFFKQAKHVS